MKTTGKSAFTLLELIVVIGIIAILMGVALSQFGGSTESAKAAKCETNMRNLVTAAHTCAMEEDNGHFPAAESFSYRYISVSSSTRGYKSRIGWISGSETRPKHSKESIAFMPVPFNSANDISLRYALTNGCGGAMWKAMGANRTAYQCPVHAEAVRNAFKGDKSRKGIPGWSYVMNRWFGYSYDRCWGQKKNDLSINGKTRDAARLLMFAELQAISINLPNCNEIDIKSRGDLKADPPASDAILDYTKGETIGFNHKTGNRGVTGHVAFADGHVEKIQYPRSDSQLNPLALTKALCLGHEITLIKGGYKDLQPSLD